MLKVEKRVNCDIGNTDYPIDYTFMNEYGQIRLKPHLYLDGIQVKKSMQDKVFDIILKNRL